MGCMLQRHLVYSASTVLLQRNPCKACLEYSGAFTFVFWRSAYLQCSPCYLAWNGVLFAVVGGACDRNVLVVANLIVVVRIATATSRQRASAALLAAVVGGGACQRDAFQAIVRTNVRRRVPRHRRRNAAPRCSIQSSRIPPAVAVAVAVTAVVVRFIIIAESVGGFGICIRSSSATTAATMLINIIVIVVIIAIIIVLVVVTTTIRDHHNLGKCSLIVNVVKVLDVTVTPVTVTAVTAGTKGGARRCYHFWFW